MVHTDSGHHHNPKKSQGTPEITMGVLLIHALGDFCSLRHAGGQNDAKLSSETNAGGDTGCCGGIKWFQCFFFFSLCINSGNM